jgi:hypothetical protein
VAAEEVAAPGCQRRFGGRRDGEDRRQASTVTGRSGTMGVVDLEGWERVLAEAVGRPELHAPWIQGLAQNAAASAGVLRRIITVQDRLPYPRIWLTLIDVAAETFAELAADPSVDVRRSIAENEHVDVETLAVLADDPETRVRFIAVTMANDRGLTLPAPLVARLEADEASRHIRAEARTQASRLAAASTPTQPKPVTQPVPHDPELPLSPAHAGALITSPDPAVRSRAAWDPRVPRDLALRLAEDPDDAVRLRLSLREDLTDEQRRAIAYIVPAGYHESPPWIKALEGDTGALIRLARSPHVLIRRSVARFRHLPPQAVALLADDEDFFVKLTLCQNCADAPHELVIEMYAWWHGKTTWFLTRHPNFHRPGFAEYSRHVNHRLRLLSLKDPELTVEEVVHLAAGPYTRDAALRDARMPTADVQAALLDTSKARAAAGNPTLPDSVMHALLDLAEVPHDAVNQAAVAAS